MTYLGVVRGVSAFEPSPSGRLAAYTVDTTGEELFTLMVIEVPAGPSPTVLATIPNVDVAVAWGADDTELYYASMDETGRPCRMHRLDVARSGDENAAAGRDATAPDGADAVDGLGFYVLVTNDGGAAEEGTLRLLHEVDAVGGLGRDAWKIPPVGLADKSLTAATGERTLLSVQCFERFVAIEGRQDGASVVFIWPYAAATGMVPLDGHVLASGTGGEACASDGADLLTAELTSEGQWSVQLCSASEQRYESGCVRLEHSSPVAPPRVLEVQPASLTEAPSGHAGPSPAVRVLSGGEGGQAPAALEESTPTYSYGRLWATADDGAQIPISVLWRRGTGAGADAAAAADGKGVPRAALLYGYGSYGACTEVGWDPDRLAVADCGMLHAVCHVRGGGEMGRRWHEAGRRERKPTTFTDMIACTRRLIEAGLVREGAIALEGRSAGGLLVGATLNSAPSLFAAALASVPFLDPAGTLQDASLPLTINEWEEFGNPNEAGDHTTVLGFSPVQNVQPGAEYPPCLLLPALNDARTGWWEAHKFAHAVRTRAAGGQVLVCTGDGGHFRPADPRERARERARELGFVIAALRGETFAGRGEFEQ